ncbi:hypothetical protein MHLP_04585 [Candidatus Mycoplasma haematolamae str. Purdue]|uniref:Uncharacterized protein n=1 Tax=Mycoplasma haematolamae (strain Purdue) TaxID=1212765 RepID=I7C7I0_MYCHA|nr:hypothetical protein [Candidatus Mycoplasma haematolamae]AFO52497.1 hypothetical protein MHLP_04585 [Candidatus Mycoplasma haematolamae str. Purdue]
MKFANSFTHNVLAMSQKAWRREREFLNHEFLVTFFRRQLAKMDGSLLLLAELEVTLSSLYRELRDFDPETYQEHTDEVAEQITKTLEDYWWVLPSDVLEKERLLSKDSSFLRTQFLRLGSSLSEVPEEFQKRVLELEGRIREKLYKVSSISFLSSIWPFKVKAHKTNKELLELSIKHIFAIKDRLENVPRLKGWLEDNLTNQSFLGLEKVHEFTSLCNREGLNQWGTHLLTGNLTGLTRDITRVREFLSKQLVKVQEAEKILSEFYVDLEILWIKLSRSVNYEYSSLEKDLELDDEQLRERLEKLEDSSLGKLENLNKYLESLEERVKIQLDSCRTRNVIKKSSCLEINKTDPRREYLLRLERILALKDCLSEFSSLSTWLKEKVSLRDSSLDTLDEYIEKLSTRALGPYRSIVLTKTKKAQSSSYRGLAVSVQRILKDEWEKTISVKPILSDLRKDLETLCRQRFLKLNLSS